MSNLNLLQKILSWYTSIPQVKKTPYIHVINSTVYTTTPLAHNNLLSVCKESTVHATYLITNKPPQLSNV